MITRNYRVISAHRSEYPDPIVFSKGELLKVGERYEGQEDWQDWFFCSTKCHEGGWVPLQIIEMLDEHQARAREDYTARELDVAVGEQLAGVRSLNGWIWCERSTPPASGWVPCTSLEPLDYRSGT